MTEANDTTPKDAAPRTVREIAREISQTWKKPYFGAVPYIEAMLEFDTPADTLIAEDGSGILRRFLTNAVYWRGEDARRIKAEIKALLGD